MEIVLASASPRRRELLTLITEEFTVCPVDADETLRPEEALEREVVRLSCSKAQAAQAMHPTAVCIGSDTLVTIDGMALGKPADAAQAADMLRRLRGRTHEVLTGLAVLPPGGAARTLCTRTRVTFRDFAEDELAAYLATGEPMDKAGAYGIQGHGALLVERIEGDYYSVMGLPVAGLHVLLRELCAGGGAPTHL
ncbi:Maf family protein [Agathobaculum desmolans]|uniref:Maf family protein n=1 Tax=Agathobaculum desmolans TaxID=39484 RepID=UPI0004E21699|nr:Maf family protein [Agathobaculum desmolans]